MDKQDQDRFTDDGKLKNPYSLSETLEKLWYYLESIQNVNAGALLEKAVLKAKGDDQFARELESALLQGSTLECRAVFAHFGSYWKMSQDTFPPYPHADAVDSIDSAMFHIKLGNMDEAIADYNFLHNRVGSSDPNWRFNSKDLKLS